VTAAIAMPSTRARRWGFRTVAYSLMIVLLGANQPTPLYAVYQRVDRLSTTMLTLLFIAYVLAVALALVLAGQLSDRYGRRAVLLPALALALTSAGAFALSSGLVWLLVGRITSGLASGAVTALAPAALAELEVDRDLDRASVVASTATVLGLALGPMISGLLVEYGPWPTRLVYVLQILALLPALTGALILPRITPEAGHEPATRGLRLPHVPAAGRALFARATVAFGSGWVATAMFFALGPTFAALILGTHNQALTAGIVFTVFSASAAAQLLSRLARPAPRSASGSPCSSPAWPRCPSPWPPTNPSSSFWAPSPPVPVRAWPTVPPKPASSTPPPSPNAAKSSAPSTWPATSRSPCCSSASASPSTTAHR